MTHANAEASVDFIRQAIAQDIASNAPNVQDGVIVTRFPPEPNGYLHIGHAMSIVLNFGLADEFDNARCHLRFDDTNPSRENVEYTDAIQRDVRWLGYDWGDHLYFASDYFESLYEHARTLIRNGKAYVCELSAEETREYRGTLKAPGRHSPYRDRGIDENLDLFQRMRDGGFAEGGAVLRAKIDMASPNLNMRDPVLYRVQRTPHHRTGDAWCIYPMYDFAHAVSDATEHVSHSLCTLEFEAHRPLYDWVIRELDLYPSRQIEFARLNVSHTITSKRKLLRLVEEKHVAGWDDPRMPTIAAMRRRGYLPQSLKTFCTKAGITKRDKVNELALLEHCLREDLNATALRVLAVLDPIRLVIENYPEAQIEYLEAVNNPEDDGAGTRTVPFSRELYIERDDFMEDPPKKFFRLGPGREVRLRYGYFVSCTGFETDDDGRVTTVRCTYDPETRGGQSPDGRKVKGTIHWVSAAHAIDAEVRLFDTLFTASDPNDVPDGADFTMHLNPESLIVRQGCKVEPSLAAARPGVPYQFERLGYFVADWRDHTTEAPVFNRTVTLRDTWGKMTRKGQVS